MLDGFSASDLIQYEILKIFCSDNDIDFSTVKFDSLEEFNILFDDMTDGFEDDIHDIQCELRYQGSECNLSPEYYSRHYEVDCVVYQIGDKWVCWDYYYGGGKHGDPDSAHEWQEHARIVEVVSEKEVTYIERTFKLA